ncbi:FecR domain-containing protein [Patescibacteria group bacterium]|nr:FecR domain-containing protein [Patescibacteria group bacterium]
MDDLFPQIPSEELNRARKRIWNSLEASLPERDPVLSTLRMASKNVEATRLKKVQAKERILDLLPDHEARPSYRIKAWHTLFERRVWSVATLSVLFVSIFAPLFQMPVASAGVSNVLEMVRGSATVVRNSELIHVDDALVLFEGDRVRMEEGAMANIQFVDDSRISLASDADVVLTELFVNPGNSARTEVVVDVFGGQVWTQVLNLVSGDSFLAVRFSNGEVVARQRASFNISVSENKTELKVARNLVDLMVRTEDLVHTGTLGQGAFALVYNDEFSTGELSSEQMSDVWWMNNLAYGKQYALSIDEKYKKEAEGMMVLPGHILYPLKSLQENIQDMVTFTEQGKERLAMQRVKTRLSEAKVLVAKGDDIKAAQALDGYDNALTKAATIVSSDDLAAKLEESQKEFLSLDSKNMEKIDSHTEVLTVSQKLSLVPDLIEGGHYQLAYDYLLAYKEKSFSAIYELESLPLEERETKIEEMLPAKLKDLHMLRIIAAMPELGGAIDINSQMIQEMSMMILTLRERELKDLSAFIQDERAKEDQFDLYTRLKDPLELTPQVSEQFQALEQQVSQSETGSVVVEIITTEAATDPRLEVSHANKAEDETESSD